MLYRLCILITNVFFPPLAVLILTGPSTDTALSFLLLLAGVLPSHIHGFYLSWIYFQRRRRVRKGQYPGPRPRHALIYDMRVWNGGLSEQKVEELRMMAVERERERRSGKKKAKAGVV